MRTIAIQNLKGGVAKTTTVINLAAILATEHKKRVLVIDADSQCNVTEFFGVNPEAGNLAWALRAGADGAAQAEKSIQHTDYHGLDVLPGDSTLMDLDLTAVKTGVAQLDAIKHMLVLLSANHTTAYDYVLIDCPPAFNAAAAAALAAADEVIIPIKLDAFSLRGMANLTRQIHNMTRINPRLTLLGVLPTMWYNSPETIQAEKTLRQVGGLTVLPRIRRSDMVDEMTYRRLPLPKISPHSAASIDYRRFVRWYLNKRGGYHHG